MATSFGEWMLRMAMLVLAGLVTLSILGALAAMSNNAARDVGSEPRGANAPVVPAAEPQPPPDPEARPAAGGGPPVDPARGQQVISAAPRSEPAASPEWINRWLEAIAYALLALAGLLALAILLLWRGVRQLRRLADSAERGGN